MKTVNKKLNTLKEITDSPIILTTVSTVFKMERNAGKYNPQTKQLTPDTLMYYFNNNYTTGQIYQLALGILEGIDITIYGKKEFSEEQMKEIRFGLLQGINILEHINFGFRFNHFQLKEIRICLENGFDPSIFANPRISWIKMREIRALIENGNIDEARSKANKYLIEDYDYEDWAMDYCSCEPYKPHKYIKLPK